MPMHRGLFVPRDLELKSPDKGKEIMQKLQAFLKQHGQAKITLVQWLLCQRPRVEVAKSPGIFILVVRIV